MIFNHKSNTKARKKEINGIIPLKAFELWTLNTMNMNIYVASS